MATALARQLPETQAAAVPAAVARLRMAALACRAAPRAPGPQVVPPEAGAERLAAALAALLLEALEQRPILWRPGTEGLSFDESWIVALTQALERGDGTASGF